MHCSMSVHIVIAILDGTLMFNAYSANHMARFPTWDIMESVEH